MEQRHLRDAPRCCRVTHPGRGRPEVGPKSVTPPACRHRHHELGVAEEGAREGAMRRHESKAHAVVLVEQEREVLRGQLPCCPAPPTSM